VLWYSAVGRLGTARAGLLTGVAPAAAVGVGVAMSGSVPGPVVWLGIAVVAAGLVLGLTAAPPADLSRAAAPIGGRRRSAVRR